jgi:hypothetical protein
MTYGRNLDRSKRIEDFSTNRICHPEHVALGERKMKRRIISVIVLALTIIIVLTLCAQRMQVRADGGPQQEPSLESILDSLGFTNRINTTDETFPNGTYKVTLFAEYAGYRDNNTLNWYVSTGESEPSSNLIFSGPEGVPPGQDMGMVSPPLTKSFTAAEQFGLSLWSLDGTWYTETWRNNDNNTHAKVYRDLDDPKMLFIGFENSNGVNGADFDYNDMVISLSAGGVPTPKGTNVTVFPAPDTCFTFENVTAAGSTTATNSTPPTPPSGMKLIGSYYEINITAGYTGNITIIMSYDPESNLVLLRYDALATDVNKDSKVDWRDICRVLMALGSRSGSRRYDAACDINHDGVVNCKDLLAVMKDFGKSAWTNITTFVDTTNHLIYGETGHFSGIGVHQQA